MGRLLESSIDNNNENRNNEITYLIPIFLLIWSTSTTSWRYFSSYEHKKKDSM